MYIFWHPCWPIWKKRCLLLERTLFSQKYELRSTKMKITKHNNICIFCSGSLSLSENAWMICNFRNHCTLMDDLSSSTYVVDSKEKYSNYSCWAVVPIQWPSCSIPHYGTSSALPFCLFGASIFQLKCGGKGKFLSL